MNEGVAGPARKELSPRTHYFFFFGAAFFGAAFFFAISRSFLRLTFGSMYTHIV